MVLKFFGRESGFSDEHTSAYFTTRNNELVIIDCPVSTFQKLKSMNLNDYTKFYVLITHTHGDHICGLGLFAQYAYFVLKERITIIAPSDDVLDDIITVLNIEGNDRMWYRIITTYELKNANWLIDCIPTKHSPQLDGKCFGYSLLVNGTHVVYTGDTCTLEPFIPHLKKDYELYVDTSIHYGQIHLKFEDVLDNFLALNELEIMIFLIHLDDVNIAKKLTSCYPGINVVHTF